MEPRGEGGLPGLLQGERFCGSCLAQESPKGQGVSSTQAAPLLSASCENTMRRSGAAGWACAAEQSCACLQVHGRDWKRLGQAVPNKTETQIKNYFQNYKTKVFCSICMCFGPASAKPGLVSLAVARNTLHCPEIVSSPILSACGQMPLASPGWRLNQAAFVQLGLDRLELPATAIHLGQRRRKVDSASPATTHSTTPPLQPPEPSALPISDTQVSRPANCDILLEAACNDDKMTR